MFFFVFNNSCLTLKANDQIVMGYSRPDLTAASSHVTDPVSSFLQTPSSLPSPASLSQWDCCLLHLFSAGKLGTRIKRNPAHKALKQCVLFPFVFLNSGDRKLHPTTAGMRSLFIRLQAPGVRSRLDSYASITLGTTEI